MISDEIIASEYLGTDKGVNAIQPLVSVCVITYNHAPFIEECLDSILMQQTDFPFEIIIGEDSSTDGTREICIRYAERHPDKVRLFLRRPDQKVEVGGKKTFHFNFYESLKAARGEYFALCDGDDYWLVKDKLKLQVEFMQKNPDCHLLCHKMPSFQNSKEGWYNFIALAEAVYLPHASNYLMKRFDLNFYKDAFFEFLGGEMLVLYIAAKGGRIYHDEQVVSHYRYSGQGVYSSLDRITQVERWMNELRIVNKYFPLPKTIYFQRRLSLLMKHKKITKKKSLEASFYRLFFFTLRMLNGGKNKKK